MTQLAGEEEEQPRAGEATLEGRFSELMQRFWRTSRVEEQSSAAPMVAPPTNRSEE